MGNRLIYTQTRRTPGVYTVGNGFKSFPTALNLLSTLEYLFYLGGAAMADQDEGMFEVLFNQLIMSLNEAAMFHLGKLINPITGRVDRSLAQARGTIDLLRMLKSKTQRNLSEREQQLLDQILVTLQMNLVHESNRQSGKRADAFSEEPGAEDGEYEADELNASPSEDSDRSPRRPEQNN